MAHRSRSAVLLGLFFFSPGCGTATSITASPVPVRNRLESIPDGNLKGSPETDFWPPTAAAGWSKPVPLGGPVNTAGGEDSPFITPDGNTLYFFFTPDVSTPVQQSVFDGVTGIWASRRSGDSWTEPERILLTEMGEWALDGCEIVRGDRMYFCSIRAGNSREIEWYYATWIDGAWKEVKGAGEWMNGPAEVGEMHITDGYRDIYFASKGGSGLGGLDIWAAHSTADGWSEPENLGRAVNTAGDENRPFVTEDGQELWFDSSSRSGKVGPAIFRCLRQADSTWGQCEEIFSIFAGEPVLTGDGRTLYFIHHFYSADLQTMIEADIYVSYRE